MSAKILPFKRKHNRRIPTGSAWVDQYEQQIADAADEVATFVFRKAAEITQEIDITFLANVLLGCANAIIDGEQAGEDGDAA